MKLLLPQIVLFMVQLVVVTYQLLHPTLEHHSDPLGASDRDLCHPDGVFCPMRCCLRFIPGSALLPQKEEKRRLWQSGKIRFCYFKNKIFEMVPKTVFSLAMFKN